MTQLTIQQALHVAVQHHQAGRLVEAEKLYRQVLAQEPENADALHLLGTIAQQVGRNDIALDLIRRAILLSPNFAEAYGNLGNVLKDMQQLDEAITAFRQAIALKPDYAKAHNNLGSALSSKGQLGEAIAAFRQAIALRPGLPEFYYTLGNTLSAQGELDQAITAFRQAIALQPDFAEAHNNLGSNLTSKGQLDEAIVAFRQAITLMPNFPEAYCNLGNALNGQGRLDESIVAFRQAIALAPNYAAAYNNLGLALKGKGQLDEAIAAFRQAIAFNPNLAAAQINLGNALKDTGELAKAIAAYRQAIALRPNLTDAHSNLLLALQHDPRCDGHTIAREHRLWNQQHAEPLRKLIQPHSNNRDPNRRLRVGYVSADFRDHPVGRFILPLFQHHDHRQFELYCYANVTNPDGLTTRLQTHTAKWRQITHLDDEKVAGQIRDDAIDILIDLSGHTAGNRLLVFARKPAPVQVSYLGYPDATGLTAIDYVLTDLVADRPDRNDCDRTLYRLPQTNWCFAEIENSPSVSPPPVKSRGYLTFGSFNNSAKVTDQMFQVWSEILRQVPGSRLLLKSAAFSSESVRRGIERNFVSLGLDIDRLILLGKQPDYISHLATYREMDIALDTFPYHGTTTTCEALWMGVPVITLAGQRHVSRVGVSLLGNLGLSDLVAATPKEYLRLAVTLAGDQERIASMRLSLRESMRGSPLMDAAKFAGNVETAYRRMWHTWCRTASAR